MVSQHIQVVGIVQGVGFRPFVYNLALQHGLCGQVRNTSAGVDIAIEGAAEALQAFTHALRTQAPPLARIEAVTIAPTTPQGFAHFEICASVAQPGAFQPIPPDVALCADCERELFDPADHRYLYPFINCTHCGPRYTLIRDLPYDRPATTMAAFPLCATCAREYRDPLNRRFHAQPVACPVCGPQLHLVAADQMLSGESLAAILQVRRLLHAGQIVALKGLGGFHLACDATNAMAVTTLRQRKGRVGKPLAVMVADLAVAEALCDMNSTERALLLGREKPIVLLAQRPQTGLAPAVAPGVPTLGVMLPYTPLHHLLLNQTDATLAVAPAPRALVMTSGNYSEEPIASTNTDALQRLAPLADAFLLHNRDIQVRCDDSVVRVVNPWSGGNQVAPHPLFIRRARGYAPAPLPLPFAAPPILAVGAELKNTFCLTRERAAFLSQHIGDLENAETLAAFGHSVEHLTRLFRIEPQVVAHDLHPNYLSTRWALRYGAATQRRTVAIQHHHAHIAAVMADNGLDGTQSVIGVAFDGTGYGPDQAIWGGEFLIADYKGYQRAAHLEYLPLPGGDAAIRHPWRIALGYATALGLAVRDLPFLQGLEPRVLEVVQKQVARQLNAPRTSSLGRLFDAVAALANVRGEVTYEAQAAIELETLAQIAMQSAPKPYPYHLETVDGVTRIRLAELLAAIAAAVRQGVAPSVIAARFHHTVAAFTLAVCQQLRAQTGLNAVGLSGGVWQNLTLLNLVCDQLQAADFTVYTHRQVPPNDGGLALGQAAIAAHLT